VGVPEPGLGLVVRRLARLPARLWHYRDLLGASLARERRARLQGTALGVLWPFLQPLCLFAVYGIFFGSVLGVRMPSDGRWGLSPDWAYGLWLWTGALVWASFSECMTRGASCVVLQGGIVRKLAFPSELLPLEVVLSSLITLGTGLLAFLAASWIWLGLTPSATLLWLPVLLGLQLLWTWGLTLFLSAMQVRLRDTAHALGILLSLVLFATPVFWVPATEVLPGIASWMGLIEANPLHHLLNAWRGALLPGAPASCFTHSVARSVLTLVPWAGCTFLVGCAVFSASQDRFADEV
jgi:ABC-type polysaccharide/polyol phosphate export permease